MRKGFEMENTDYIKAFDGSISGLFRDAARITLSSPRRAIFFGKMLMAQLRASKVRERLLREENLRVPPLSIISVTRQCNLHCKGCYAHAQDRIGGEGLTSEKLLNVISQADDIGMRIAVVVGGEPFTRNDLFKLAQSHKSMVFAIFTNGLLFDDDVIALLKRTPNLVPIISIEGGKEETDRRRGEGTFEKVHEVMSKLKRAGVFYGNSITVTSGNTDLVTSGAFVEGLLHLGSRIFFYVEYVPFEAGTQNSVPDDAQRVQLVKSVKSFRKHFPGLFIAFPGEENESTGCLAAGKGFVHISARGEVEPCPFAPFSDSSLQDMSLKNALRSEFLRKIRESHGMLDESGGCALFNQRVWLERELGACGKEPCNKKEKVVVLK
ncbi:MAG: radical SAM protein [Caldisericales bacterium]|nr:radical SAM protein [Caldisericales bacterium]